MFGEESLDSCTKVDVASFWQLTKLKVKAGEMADQIKFLLCKH